MSKIIVIVPCFNEEKRFLSLNWKKEFDYFSSFDFLFVNDGSSDKTAAILTDFSEGFDNVYSLNFTDNLGKANAIRRAVLKTNPSKYRYVAYLDADLATPVSELYKIYEILRHDDNLQFAMGSRIKLIGNKVQRSLWRHYFGRVFATLVSQFVLKFPVYDTQCGAKVIESDLALELFAKPFETKWLFDVELLLRFKQKDINLEQKIKEIPLDIWEEKGKSKIKFLEFFIFPVQLLKIYIKYA